MIQIQSQPVSHVTTIDVDMRSIIKKIVDDVRGVPPSVWDFARFAGRMTFNNVFLKFDEPVVLGEKIDKLVLPDYILYGVIPLREGDWVECSIDTFERV